MRTWTALIATFGLWLPSAHAADWPTKPVRIIVTFPAGGATDLLGRQVAQVLAKSYGQQFFVENRPGASGNVGAEIVAKSPPDGSTVLLSTPGPQAGLPPDIVTGLNQRLNEYISSDEGRKRLAYLGVQPIGGTPQDLDNLVRAEIARWGPVIEGMGISLQ